MQWTKLIDLQVNSLDDTSILGQLQCHNDAIWKLEEQHVYIFCLQSPEPRAQWPKRGFYQFQNFPAMCHPVYQDFRSLSGKWVASFLLFRHAWAIHVNWKETAILTWSGLRMTPD
eukprot:g43909.t1